jgi:DNA-binding XRE family transcriptional regulator
MKPYGPMNNWKLRAERIQQGWTQARLAQALGVSTKTVVRWELGQTVPYPYYRKQLSTLFGKTVQELGLFWDAENRALDIGEQALHSVIQRATPEVPTQASLLVNPAIPQPLAHR